MLDKKASQEQNQSVNIGGEHGRPTELKCEYLGLPKYERFPVSVLIYQGQVTRVFCKFYSKCNCTKPENETKNCYINNNN